jgi:hypothetical protein
MTKKILNFEKYKLITEGGAAIKSSRSIRQDEFVKTLDHIKEVLFPLLEISPNEVDGEFISIGSLGKKKEMSETSGDLDIGYDAQAFSQRHSIPINSCSSEVYRILSENIAGTLGYETEIKHIPGFKIVSIGWPIEGDPSKGSVQVDLIPISNMEWANFIYYSPDYRRDESKYKSAHRNWLLSAILSARINVLDRDQQGEVMDYDSPVLILSDGLFWHKKSYRGTLKPRLKHSKKVEGSERFITNDPQEFIDFTLGPGYSQEDIKTFEDLFSIITGPDFDLKEKLPEIKQRYIDYMERVKLPIPSELNSI